MADSGSTRNMQSRMLRIYLNESVVAAELDEEMVLLNVETGIYFGLDELGAVIWKLLTEEADETAIIDRIAAAYEVERARVEGDLHAFLNQLTHAGLIQLETW
jgi:hypothetical protein